ncbi:MAG: hypothetical protein HY689_10775 [Chloroflexi bacterium]|nr:hypothetical protein [Chloroflexota bacterium]
MKRMHRFATAIAGLSTAAALLMPATMTPTGTTLAAATPDTVPIAVAVPDAKPVLGGAAPKERCLILTARPVVFKLDDDRLTAHTEALLNGEGCGGKTAAVFVNGHKVAEMTVEDGAILGGQMIKKKGNAQADGIHVHIPVNGQQTSQLFFKKKWLKAD